MKNYFDPSHFLTDTTDRLGVLLTLMFFAIFPIHAFSAGSFGNPASMTGTLQSDSANDAFDRQQRIQSMMDYAKEQVPNLLPGAPSTISKAARWALGGFHSNGNFVSFAVIGEGNVDEMASALNPATNIMQPLTPDDEGVPGLSSAYHHRHGLLPTRDAMTVGMHSQQNLLDNYISLDAHPYVAQNYFSARNYAGADLTINLASPLETSDVTQPWGKVVLGYTNGDSGLMDHGRGVDLHGELRFSDTLSLNTGMRQSDTTGTGNYVMLQWKLATE